MGDDDGDNSRHLSEKEDRHDASQRQVQNRDAENVCEDVGDVEEARVMASEEEKEEERRDWATETEPETMEMEVLEEKGEEKEEEATESKPEQGEEETDERQRRMEMEVLDQRSSFPVEETVPEEISPKKSVWASEIKAEVALEMEWCEKTPSGPREPEDEEIHNGETESTFVCVCVIMLQMLCACVRVCACVY